MSDYFTKSLSISPALQGWFGYKTGWRNHLKGLRYLYLYRLEFIEYIKTHRKKAPVAKTTHFQQPLACESMNFLIKISAPPQRICTIGTSECILLVFYYLQVVIYRPLTYWNRKPTHDSDLFNKYSFPRDSIQSPRSHLWTFPSENCLQDSNLVDFDIRQPKHENLFPGSKPIT